MHHLARHRVEHVLQDQAGGDAAAGVQQRFHVRLLLGSQAVRLQAVNGECGEAAEVARQSQVAGREALAAGAGEHQAAVGRRSDAEGHGEPRRLTHGLAAHEHLASLRPLGEQQRQVVGAGATDEGAGRRVVLVDETLRHAQVRLRAAGDELESGTRVAGAGDFPGQLRERGFSAPAVVRREPVLSPLRAFLKEPGQVAAQELPLSARSATRRQQARVGPAPHGVLAHFQYLGCRRHAEPAPVSRAAFLLLSHTGIVGRMVSFL